MSHPVVFENVTFAYDGATPVFRDVSFELPAAPMLWVRAVDHRGRSTLLKLLGGLLRPTGGRVLLRGRDVAEMSFAEGVAARLDFGFGLDVGGLLSTQTLAQNLTLPLVYHGLLTPAAARARVDALMRRFGLEGVADLRPFEATGSQRKLTCVLRAFVHEPALVLLDEPLTGLKRADIDELVRFVREAYARRGLRGIVLTGENPLLAEPFGAIRLNITRTRVWSDQEAP